MSYKNRKKEYKRAKGLGILDRNPALKAEFEPQNKAKPAEVTKEPEAQKKKGKI